MGHQPPRFGAFNPRLDLGFQQQLQRVVKSLRGTNRSEAVSFLAKSIAATDQREGGRFQTGGAQFERHSSDDFRYAATLRLLRDLVVQGWTVREDDEGIILDSPGLGGLTA